MTTADHPLKKIGYVLVGAGTFIELYRAYARKRALASLGTLGGGLPPQVLAALNSAPRDVVSGDDRRALEALSRASGPILSQAKSTMHTVSSIDQRVGYIRELIKKGSLDPAVREAASAIVSKKCGTRGNVRWCATPKNFLEEIGAVYRAVQDPNSPLALRYVRDHVTVDQFTLAKKAIRTRAGDCDDGTCVLGSLLMSIGYPVKMRVIQDTGSSTWSHIFIVVGVPPQNPTAWIPLDWSMWPPRPAGWQAPGTEEALRTGRPAGIVARVRDFAV
jgi:hypothetical protein